MPFLPGHYAQTSVKSVSPLSVCKWLIGYYTDTHYP